MDLTLRQICLVAPELAAPVDALTAIFGIEVCYRDPGVATFGLENALMPVGDEFLEVVAPVQGDTAAGRYLKRRGGPGGYMVITLCDDADARDQRIEALGIDVAWRHEVHGTRMCQLHPRSTGGSFFEIDWQEDTDPDHWAAAGPKPVAAAARRTDVVTAITAAELQSPDPAALAQRWGEIADQSPKPDAEGRATLRFGPAQVRFVSCEDGRPEGLGGVDLRVVDPEHVFAEAERRGCRISDTRVDVCGTRFNLVR
jgi:hypothetical protein